MNLLDDEYVFKGKRYIHRNNGSRDLIIVLNTHNQGDKYFGLKTISDKINDVDILFLVDPYNKYYLDSDEGNVYKELIREVLKGYDKTSVSIFGTSMAGYAALFLGLEFDLNIISINPQLNLGTARDLAWPKLRETLDSLDSSIDIENIIKEKYGGQTLFFVFGHHRLDKQAYLEFLNLNLVDVSYYVRRVDSAEHKFFLSDLSYLKSIHFLCKELNCINKVIQA